MPPPKPPASVMTFPPSGSNNDFIHLVRLEEVIHNVLETQEERLSAPTNAALLSRKTRFVHSARGTSRVLGVKETEGPPCGTTL